MNLSIESSEHIAIRAEGVSPRSYAAGVRAGQVLADQGLLVERDTVAASFDGELVDLEAALYRDGELRPVSLQSAEGLEILRHSTAHLMAAAVRELFPETRVAIGPAIDSGFYYDFDRPEAFNPEDLARIEKKMKEIRSRKQAFERVRLPREQASALFRDAREPYKQEILEGIPDADVSLYKLGAFTDLCRGPHVPDTSWLRAFRLTSVAGAYWKGDERLPMLQRIYGTAFPSKERLQAHLDLLEEARKRDHRKLGKDLDLFSIPEDVGPGLVCWHPRGARVRTIIENFWREEHDRNGYEILYTPHLAKIHLWEISGHTGFYKENMFSPMDVEGQAYLVKPMNCPFHIQVFKSRLQSFRDLPKRWAELGTVYRYERSGVLHGLLRVRGCCVPSASSRSTCT